MNDKELLELAAKAAGIEHRGCVSWFGEVVGLEIRGITVPSYWNPLTDDGDALRLAVKLKMDIDMNGSAIEINWAIPFGASYADRVRLDIVVPVYSIGEEAATRRAIVRAAAEIGKGMR